ncbi:glycosyltransferase [Gluconobacter kanchanaburiensis]|nr:glycosyltransferase [Gluconobacter kanchanaburiensis]MBF0862067.1 glycosyltransferase [Gluconobacter kanchanaburiensis]GBR71135.1 glycosyltransferase [Gluconobacter kanchanaburiensis NBRC 103587]
MSRRAQEAFSRGQAALQGGNISLGLFWLERAERMSRTNPNLKWAVGLACLSAGRLADCLLRMRELRETYALREAAFLEVLCLVRLERLDEAGCRMQDALSRFHATPETHPIADQIAAAGGRLGWMTASNNGTLLIRAARPVRLLLDGQEVATGLKDGVHVLSEGWRLARQLEVRSGRRHVLGSPLDIAALTRCESFVEADIDGLTGWIWTPAEPEHVPQVTLWDGSHLRAEAFAQDVDSDIPLARNRIFHVPAALLPPGDPGPLELRDANGHLLTGAPVDPLTGRLVTGQTGGLAARFQPVAVRSGMPRASGLRASPGCAVVIPVYAACSTTMACLRTVLVTCPADVPVIVVDDASPEPALASALDRFAEEGRILLIRHDRNRGFPISANDGIRAAEGRDILLLNSDTLVPAGWVERLRARLIQSDTGTVTPFSNDATIMSYPSVDRSNPVPSLREMRAMDRLCRDVCGDGAGTGGDRIELPTAHGFCMAISADCLLEVGLFREDIFAQGYGEENDFCLRASAKGFRHLAAPELFVAHVGSASFGGARKALGARNLQILNALHPGYNQLVKCFIKADPLHETRRRLDAAALLRLAAGRPAVLMVQHDAGGGVGRVVRERSAAFEAAGELALALRPHATGCLLEHVSEEKRFPNLKFSLPRELPGLLDLLRSLRVRVVEWHHLIGHAPAIRTLHEALDIPCDIFIHDHIWFCPRISLCDGEGRYCGEPDQAGCEKCVSRWGGYLGEDISISGLLARSAHELSSARALMAPTDDTVRRITRHFPGLTIQTIPLEDDAELQADIRAARPGLSGQPLRVCVVGGISQWKGYDVLLDLAREIRAHRLPIELSLVGHTHDDDALIALGVRVTGEYRENEVQDLIRQQKPDVGLIPSIAPETWCYALGQVWRSGLEAVCFDLGAQGERVRKSGAGLAIPLGIPAFQLAAILMRKWGSSR